MNALQRSLKILTDKVLTLLGFAAKAGKLSYGMNSTVSSILTNKAKLAVLSGEISPKSQKEIIFYANKKNIPVTVFEEFDIQTLSDAVGRKCGIISINDSSFADALAKAGNTGGNANE